MILALNMTMVADLCSDETRYDTPSICCFLLFDYLHRSQMLYLTSAFKYVAAIAGPQTASIALAHSLWLPILLCQLIFATSLLILGIIPETLKIEPRKDQHLQANVGPNRIGVYRALLMDWRIIIGLVITFLTQFRYLNESILLPYVSVRFSWSVRQVSLLE